MLNSGHLRITWRGFLFYLLLVALFFRLLKTTSHRKRMSTINEIGKDVYLMLIEAGFTPIQAQYITAQSAHETANFTSTIFIQNKNLFGYKYVGQSWAKGEKNGHSDYESLYNSVQDFKRYYQIRGYSKIYPTLAEYVKTLKRNNYFEASEAEYLSGCKHFYNLYFSGTK